MKTYLINFINHLKTNPIQDGIVFVVGFIVGAWLL